MQQMEKQAPSTQKQTAKSLDEQLIDAASALNNPELVRLLKLGANPKHVRHSGMNDWYSGNTDTALYVAVHADFKGDETNYVNAIETLLKAGSDPNFKALRGNWNHCTEYPLFSGVAYKLALFKSEKEKIRFIQMFVKSGGNINQTETHSRSKNWRGYRTHTSFIFQVLDSCGLHSRLGQLLKDYEQVDIEKMNAERRKELQAQFQKQHPEFKFAVVEGEEGEGEGEEDAQKEEQEEQKKKTPQTQFIEALLNFGANPKSHQSRSSWQNYNNDYYDEENNDYEEFGKYDTRLNQEYETLLHRAIMHDLPKLVKMLLEKGADVGVKYKFTITIPVYPHDWPERLKERKIGQVQKSIKELEEQKQELLERIKNPENEEAQNSDRENLKYTELQLFKAKRFTVENECPIPINEVKELSSLQLAQKLKVSNETIQLIKEAEKTQKK